MGPTNNCLELIEDLETEVKKAVTDLEKEEQNKYQTEKIKELVRDQFQEELEQVLALINKLKNQIEFLLGGKWIHII